MGEVVGMGRSCFSLLSLCVPPFSLPLLLGACGTREELRAEIVLGQGWSAAPWSQSPHGTAQSLTLAGSFRLPAGQVSQRAELLLEGLWFEADVLVDDRPIGRVYGGNAPLRVDLGDAFADGEARLTLQIRKPADGDTPAVTGGGLYSNADRGKRLPAWLAEPPVLVLHPTHYIDRIALRAEETQVQAMAWLGGDIDPGSRVRFEGWLDGRSLGSLGEGPVDRQGDEWVARADLQPWSGPWWTPVSPGLFHLQATLIDEAGDPVDQLSRRLGVVERRVSPAGLHFGQEVYKPLAARLLAVTARGPLLPVAQPLLDAGLNALEVHGEFIPGRWWREADELGIPLIYLPRCAGMSGQSGPVPPKRASLVAEQEARVLQASLDHPSIALWVDEPPPQKKPEPSRVSPDDPLQRPAVPQDIPGFAMEGLWAAEQCLDGPCAGAFIREQMGGTSQGWGAVANYWKQLAIGLHRGPIWGGVAPSPAQPHSSDYVQQMAPALAEAGVQPLRLGDGRRASSIVVVSGLTPGEIVTLRAPGVMEVGAVVAPSGQASLRLWHSGTATLRAGERSLHVELLPSLWAEGDLRGKATQVDLGPAAP
jgi:hypothetical protein